MVDHLRFIPTGLVRLLPLHTFVGCYAVVRFTFTARDFIFRFTFRLRFTFIAGYRFTPLFVAVPTLRLPVATTVTYDVVCYTTPTLNCYLCRVCGSTLTGFCWFGCCYPIPRLIYAFVYDCVRTVTRYFVGLLFPRLFGLYLPTFTTTVGLVLLHTVYCTILVVCVVRFLYVVVDLVPTHAHLPLPVGPWFTALPVVLVCRLRLVYWTFTVCDYCVRHRPRYTPLPHGCCRTHVWLPVALVI